MRRHSYKKVSFFRQIKKVTEILSEFLKEVT